MCVKHATVGMFQDEPLLLCKWLGGMETLNCKELRYMDTQTK